MGSPGDGEEGIAEPANSNSAPAHCAEPTGKLVYGKRDGDGNEWMGKVSVMEDTVPVTDYCETQMLEFDETQLVEDEPDRYDDTVKTQLVDDDVASDSDQEVSEYTDVLSHANGDHGEGLSDGESARKPGENLLVEERKESMGHASGFPSDGQCRPGAGWFSVRAASFRASGLAARKMAFERTRNLSVQSNGGSSERCLAEIDGSELNACDTVYPGFATVRYDEEAKRLNCGSKCKIGSSTVRKLFTDDAFVETEALTCDHGVAASTRELQLSCDDKLAGLSYVDSQEPGEASQANALACVQKLIDESKDLFGDEFNPRKSNRGMKSGGSTAKGPQSLAKKVSAKGTSINGGAFDWDDRLEDEGGGEFFSRKKEELLGSARMITSRKTQISKKHYPDEGTGNEGKSNVNNAAMVLEMGPRDLERNGKTAKETEKRVARDLVSDFGEEIATEQVVQKFDATSSGKNMQEILYVGVDTQMAAEAMEALFNGEAICTFDAANNQQGQKGSLEDRQIGPSGRNSERTVLAKQNCPESEFVARGLRRKKRISKRVSGDSGECSSESSKRHGRKLKLQPDQDLVTTKKKTAKCDSKGAVMTRRTKQSEKLNTLHDQDLVMTRSKRVKFNTEKAVNAFEKEVPPQMPKETVEQMKDAGPTKHNLFGGLDKSVGAAHNGCPLAKKRNMPEEFSVVLPIACRARRSLVQLNDTGIHLGNSTGLKNKGRENSTAGQNEASHECTMTSRALVAKNKSSDLRANDSDRHENLISKLRANGDEISCSRRRRSVRNISVELNKFDSRNAQLRASVPFKKVVPQSKCRAGQSRHKGKVNDLELSGSNLRSTRSSCFEATFVRVDPNEVSHAGVDVSDSAISKPQLDENGLEAKAANIANNRDDMNAFPSAESKVAASPNMLQGKKKKALKSDCTSPANCITPAKVVSPVCMGNGYVDQSCKKGLSRTSLLQEISGLRTPRVEQVSTPKDSRKRRDLSSVKVLFSQHLDDDILKQMKKIAERLEVSIASAISDATHFIADEFVRTRNMLVAIAGGKPVVTHQWLEDVGRANYCIDEQKYILRDAKKEKEIGFNMAVSLALARKTPLFQGRRVFITSNVKPGRDTVSCLVKEVHGQATERIGRSTLKDDTTSDELLILSCEEDYETCLPFLEKGMAVYSSELLLNGIVTQRLEYERHRLFSDNVKRTRSTVWLKKDGRAFVPVKKQKNS